MKPIKFKEMNATMMENVDSKTGRLPICKTDKGWISCWKMGLWDRIRAVVFGRIWLYTYSPKFQHPVSLACIRNLFKRIKPLTPDPSKGYKIPKKRRTGIRKMS